MAKKGTIGNYSQAKLAKIIDDKVAAGGGGGGSGDVTGPGSSTDNAITRFDGTGGKTLQNSGCTIDDSNNVTIAGDLTISGNDIKGSGGTAITMDGSNNVTIAGDLTISGDDLFMATNTDGYILVADGTNFNPSSVAAIAADVNIILANQIFSH